MSMASTRVLMRLLAGAFLLLLGNATDGRARSVHSHRDSRTAIAAASESALLAATPVVGEDVDAALPPLLASEASLPADAQVESAPAPIRVASSLCSCERTTVEAARPPPFQS
jgi:hypothetical protein